MVDDSTSGSPVTPCITSTPLAYKRGPVIHFRQRGLRPCVYFRSVTLWFCDGSHNDGRRSTGQAVSIYLKQLGKHFLCGSFGIFSFSSLHFRLDCKSFILRFY